MLVNIFGLFTSNFAIKAGECDGKGLHSIHGVVIVQSEYIVSYPSKLHHNVVHWKKAKIYQELRADRRKVGYKSLTAPQKCICDLKDFLFLAFFFDKIITSNTSLGISRLRFNRRLSCIKPRSL